MKNKDHIDELVMLHVKRRMAIAIGDKRGAREIDREMDSLRSRMDNDDYVVAMEEWKRMLQETSNL